MKRYKSPAEAKDYYFPPSTVASSSAMAICDVGIQTDDAQASHVSTSMQTDGPHTSSGSTQTSTETKNIGIQVFMDENIEGIRKNINKDSRLDALSHFFTELSQEFGLSVPDDFLVLSTRAMCQLKKSDRTNVIYFLAKGLGIPRTNEDDSRFPSKRMPMGLVEYTVNFFATEEHRKVSSYYCFHDYHSFNYYIATSMPYGLSPVVTNDVLSVWTEMGKTSPRSHVECFKSCCS